jgi:FKBP-type peptidyl-prolyl cis-trans isomerase
MQKYMVTAAIAAALLFGIFVMIYKRQTEGPMEQKKNELITLDSGLQYQIIQEGSGNQAKAGDRATVHYTGWLYEPKALELKGMKFDSSVDRGQPFQFNLGAGMVIHGWDEGVALMKAGEKRRFIIPAHMAYGDRAVGGIIPANATLVFDVELLKLN